MTVLPVVFNGKGSFTIKQIQVGEADVRNELRLGFYDPQDECVGSVALRVDSDGTPQVKITTDGDSYLDKGSPLVVVSPTRPYQEAVSMSDTVLGAPMGALVLAPSGNPLSLQLNEVVVLTHPIKKVDGTWLQPGVDVVIRKITPAKIVHMVTIEPMGVTGTTGEYLDIPLPFLARKDAPVDRVPWEAVARDMAGALNESLTQIEQMKGLFDDADGAIERAIEDIDEAMSAYRAAAAGRTAQPELYLATHRHRHGEDHFLFDYSPSDEDVIAAINGESTYEPEQGESFSVDRITLRRHGDFIGKPTAPAPRG